jgi:hypothetical protein
VRKQYHFRPSPNGFYAWDIDRLIELSKDFESLDVRLDSIHELDENFWFANQDDIPTVRAIVGHIKLIEETDLKFPIILSSEGRIMDGMHRVSKALLKDLKTIKAVRFTETPKPDYSDVQPNDLPY